MTDSLFDDAPPPVPKKKRQKKPPDETDGVAVRLETAFIERHRALWNCEPFRSSYSRERKLLKDMAVQLGEPEVLALIDQFFSNRNRRGDYTVLDFGRQAAALRLERQRRPVDLRTAANLDAAARATGRK